MPVEWEEHMSSKGRKYFYNSHTKETQWTEPTLKKGDTIRRFQSKNKPIQAGKQLDESPLPTDLPPGWEAAREPTEGAVYYFNRSTGVRQWEHPNPLRSTLENAGSLQSNGRSSASTKSVAQESPEVQRLVDGFEGLSVSDPGRLEKINPDGRQSWMLCPLIYSAYRRVPKELAGRGTASKAQIAEAQQWWSKTFSGWPDWVEELASRLEGHEELLFDVDAYGVPLVPGHASFGTVPHIKAASQETVMHEIAPRMISTQISASIATLSTIYRK